MLIMGRLNETYLQGWELNENICCGYSLEAPRRGAYNEYPQDMYSSRNKKNMWIPPLICSYVAAASEDKGKVLHV